MYVLLARMFYNMNIHEGKLNDIYISKVYCKISKMSEVEHVFFLALYIFYNCKSD